MKVGNYQIRWKYTVRSTNNGVVRINTTDTRCEIIKEESLLSIGVSYCHEKDNFSRAKGRKISLTRALSVSGIPKEERKDIWEAYRNMTPKPRW